MRTNIDIKLQSKIVPECGGYLSRYLGRWNCSWCRRGSHRYHSSTAKFSTDVSCTTVVASVTYWHTTIIIFAISGIGYIVLNFWQAILVLQSDFLLLITLHSTLLVLYFILHSTLLFCTDPFCKIFGIPSNIPHYIPLWPNMHRWNMCKTYL